MHRRMRLLLPAPRGGHRYPAGNGRAPGSAGAHRVPPPVAGLGPRNRPEAWLHRRLVIPDPTISLARAA